MPAGQMQLFLPHLEHRRLLKWLNISLKLNKEGEPLLRFKHCRSRKVEYQFSDYSVVGRTRNDLIMMKNQLLPNLTEAVGVPIYGQYFVYFFQDKDGTLSRPGICCGDKVSLLDFDREPLIVRDGLNGYATSYVRQALTYLQGRFLKKGFQFPRSPDTDDDWLYSEPDTDGVYDSYQSSNLEQDQWQDRFRKSQIKRRPRRRLR